MDFQQSFLYAIQANTSITKKISVADYLPKDLSTPEDIKENLPYIQAYGNIQATYPYYYEINQLNSYCLLFTERGNGTLFIDNQNFSLSPCTLALIDCQKNHRIEIKQSSWNYKIFFMTGKPISYLYTTITRDGYLHTIPLGSTIPNLIHKLYEQISANSDKPYFQVKLILDILLEIIGEKERLKEIESHVPDYLYKIKSCFDSDYQNKFTLESLEREYHISKYRICREFKDQFCMSPIQYLNYRRIEASEEALINTDKRINEIGRMVGFENTNHLIRLFKQQTGVTPLAYRRNPPAF